MSRKLILFFFVAFLLSCNNGKVAEQKPTRLSPQYYFFPKANVYFDSANKEYLFPSSGDTAWQIAKQIPAVTQALMDKSVLIQKPSAPVWRDNAQHKLIYSAVLYATPSDTVEKKEPVKKVKRSRHQSDSSNDNRKEKKGVRKFLDKIFGGLKRDKVKKDSGE